MGSSADIMAFLTGQGNFLFGWLAVLVIFLVVEVVTLGLTTIWFAAGALVAFLAAWLGAPWGIQLALFFIVSFVLLVFTRPALQKRLNSSRVKTNVNSMAGKEGKVIEEIDNFNEKGRILVGGMEWSARTMEDGKVIPVDAKVIVREVKGVKAFVAPLAGEQ